MTKDIILNYLFSKTNTFQQDVYKTSFSFVGKTLKKNIFSSSFYGCHFCKVKGRLKDLFVLPKRQYEKDNFPLFWYVLSLIREQYARSPPDGRDGVQFLVFENHTGQNKRCGIIRNFTRVLMNTNKFFFVIESPKGTIMKDNYSCT